MHIDYLLILVNNLISLSLQELVNVRSMMDCGVIAVPNGSYRSV